jgi:hypothetical protein
MAGRPRKPTNLLEMSGALKKNPKRAKAHAGEPRPDGLLSEPPERWKPPTLAAHASALFAKGKSTNEVAGRRHRSARGLHAQGRNRISHGKTSEHRREVLRRCPGRPTEVLQRVADPARGIGGSNPSTMGAVDHMHTLLRVSTKWKFCPKHPAGLGEVANGQCNTRRRRGRAAVGRR